MVLGLKRPFISTFQTLSLSHVCMVVFHAYRGRPHPEPLPSLTTNDDWGQTRARTHLRHEPLFLLHANVQQLGLIQDFFQGEEVRVPPLMPRLRVDRHT